MTPIAYIAVGGASILDVVGGRIVKVEYEDSTDEEADTCSITIEDVLSHVAGPRKGAVVALMMGYSPGVVKVGNFFVDTVTASGPPNQITISASSAPFVGGDGGASPIQGRKSRSFDETTFGAYASQVASDSGLSVIVDPSLASKQLKHLDQYAESDINTLIRLARRFGGIVKPADGRLLILAERGGLSAVGSVVGIRLAPSQVSRWSVTTGGKTAGYGKVEASTHDYETGEPVDVESGVSNADGGSSDSPFSEVYLLPDQEQAQSAADSRAGRIGRASRTFDISMPGTLGVIAGAKVTLTGFHASADGTFIAKKVKHTVDDGGWVTNVSGEGG